MNTNDAGLSTEAKDVFMRTFYHPEEDRKLIFCRVAEVKDHGIILECASGERYHFNQAVGGFALGETAGVVIDENGVHKILEREDTKLFSGIRGKYVPEELFRLYCIYADMKPEQRQYIRLCAVSGSDFDTEFFPESPVCIFNDIEELKVKFELTKATYPPDIRKYIEILFSQRKEKAFGKENEEIDERLKYLINISRRYLFAVPFQKEKLLESLNRKIIGLEAVKKAFCDILHAELVCRKKRSCVSFLRVGASGTAKTTFARLLSESIGIPFFTISCAGINTAVPFVGDEAVFDHSSPGELVKKMYQYGCTSECVILLDEVDKMVSNRKDGDPYMVLLDILGEGRHYDRYLETYIDMRHSILIGTANFQENIPEVLLQRFTHIIRFPSYTNVEKAAIGAKKVKEILQDYQLGKLSFTDRALQRIAWYTDDDGMRKYNACVQKLVTSILAEGITEGIIEEDYVDQHLFEEQEEAENDKLVFKRNDPFYDEHIKKEIRKTLSFLESCKCEEGSRAKYAEKLKLLCRLYAKPGKDAFDISSIRKTLMSSHFGMEQVKRQILRFFYSHAVTGKISGGRLLLRGETGVGKTSVTAAIARALKRPLVAINLNGVERPEVLKGFPMTYVDAFPGLLARQICRAGARCVVRLDEMEKCSLAVQNALIDLLDSSNHFVDLFLGTAIDLSETIFIATVNDSRLVTPPLRNRFYEIDLGDYTQEEKFQIARNYILPKLLRRYSFQAGQVRFEDEALCLLVEHCARTTGVREIERELENYLLDLIQRNGGSLLKKELCDVKKMRDFLEENIPGDRMRIGFV